MNDNTLKQIAACMSRLKAAQEAGNKKAASFQERTLAKLVGANPEEAKASGLDPALFSRSTCLVFTYRCLGDPIVEGSEEKDKVFKQMRLRHGYYNALVAATADLLTGARALVESGPAQADYKERKTELEACFQAIRAINQQAQRKVKTPEKDALRAKIADLKRDFRELAAKAHAERSQLRRNNATAVKLLDKEVQMRCKQVRAEYRALGLWHGNYCTVERQFARAYKRAAAQRSDRVERLHYRYETRDGNYPQAFLDWPAWDGAGAVSVLLSHKTVPREVEAVLNGTNSWFRIEPLTPESWAKFKLRPRLIFASECENVSEENRRRAQNTARVHLARVRIGSGMRRSQAVWAVVPFVLHRPLPRAAQIVEVHIQRKRVGFRTRCELQVVVKFPAFVAVKEGTNADITLLCERAHNRTLVVARWRKSGATGDLQLAPKVKRGLSQARYLNELIQKLVNRANDSIGGFLGEGARFPTWAEDEGFRFNRAKELRRAYRVWIQKLRVREIGTDAKHVLSRFRRAANDSAQTGYEGAVSMIANSAPAIFDITAAEAKLFAVLLIFAARYAHLHEWSVSLREKSLRHRRDLYRNFAARLLCDVKTLSLRADDLRSLPPSPEKLTAALSELKGCLESYAKREGVAIEYGSAERTKAAASAV